ncbi:MAG TPA: hypothetical protein VLE43_01790 [Candidatus Saccharimonadia bacterium]|nr:hypothetical protein [Candidatus Saccharimonadia bacterium]
MRTLPLLIVCLVLVVGKAHAGDPTVTYTVQALTGLVGDTPRFDRVYCHDRYAMSGEPTAFPLICAPNIPPTNSSEKLDDHNLLSASGFKIEAKRFDDTVYILLDARNIRIPKTIEQSEEELMRIGLECIRLTAHLTKLKNYSVKIEAPDRLAAKARAIAEEFKSHSKVGPFVPHPAE